MKERLTGAIVLVALMVLLVPELLTGPIRTRSLAAASRSAAAIASAAGLAGRSLSSQAPLRTYTMTLGQPPAVASSDAASAGSPQATVADDAANAQPVPAQSAPRSAALKPPASASRHAALAPVTPRAHRKASAERPADGLAAPATPVAAHAGVSSPPRRTGAAARRDLQVARKAAHPAVREAASASSSGWIVQLGSFADHRNALRLARSLEARGFRMSVSSARAGKRVLWRVRTGTARDRAGALHLAARLRALGHHGEVLPVR